MAVRHGYGKIAGTDALVFAYDTGDTRNSYRGRPTTNFFTNGHFAGGTGITQEGGSNATNEVIYFPNNPGGSDYVLRQTMGIAQTEYQINLTTQLQSNTTYVMSGWYAESPDYVGASRMFHSRAFSSSGAHTALGTGIGTVLRTVEIGGITWKYCYATITTPADYSNNFNWYLGYDGGSYTGARYYTNIMMEQGTIPSQFVNGTRSATQGLLDLTGTGTISIDNATYDSSATMTFDGSNDYISTSNSYNGSNSLSVEAILKFASVSSPGDQVVYFNANGQGLYPRLFKNTSNKFFMQYRPSGTTTSITGNTTLAANQYYHTVFTYDAVAGGILYVNGAVDGTNSSVTGNHEKGNGHAIRIGNDTNVNYYMNGEIPVVKKYNRALTADEVRNNYRHYKTRFNI